MALDEILFDAESQMEKTVDFLKQECRGMRTGRATPALVDTLRVEVESYGATMTLKELASIGVADGNVIVIKPFDPSTLKDIERGIAKSELGINPMSDGKMVRLPVPALSTERRNQLVGRVKQIGEQQKVSIRNIRRDANKAIDAEQKAKTITEDESKSGQEQVQKLTDDYCAAVDKVVEDKTKDIMTV